MTRPSACDCPRDGAYLCVWCRNLLLRSQGGARVETPAEESERTFQGRILREARQFGWLAYHDFDSRGNAKGFLDTWLCKPGHPLLALELKIGKEKATIEQQAWLQALPLAQGIVSGVYYPQDYDAIVALLARRH